MGEEQPEPSFRETLNWPILARYGAAGAAYIGLGFAFKEIFAWWTYGSAFMLLTVWGMPAMWRRFR